MIKADPAIKKVEDMSLNAWPSYKIQIYDSWLLRFSYFYTHRTNSIEQIGASTLPLQEKIDFCEEIYAKWETPTIFKISPLIDPKFEELLIDRGYRLDHKVKNMTCRLGSHLNVDPSIGIRVVDFIPHRWMDALFMLKGTSNPTHIRIVPSMYHAIPKDVICVSIRSRDRIVATGLGILDRNYVGIYAINVHPDFRHQGYARNICHTLINEAVKKGAENAYLQVVNDNEAAIGLYESLGFSTLYESWFRVKEHTCRD